MSSSTVRPWSLDASSTVRPWSLAKVGVGFLFARLLRLARSCPVARFGRGSWTPPGWNRLPGESMSSRTLFLCAVLLPFSRRSHCHLSGLFTQSRQQGPWLWENRGFLANVFLGSPSRGGSGTPWPVGALVPRAFSSAAPAGAPSRREPLPPFSGAHFLPRGHRR